MTNERGAPLQLRNRTRMDARLRFHCDSRVLWDTLLQAGAVLDVPDLACADIEIEVGHLDAQTQVTSRICTRIAGGIGRSGTETPLLVAKMLAGGGSRGFVVEQEAPVQAGVVALLNLTAVPVRLRCRFLGTPFAFVLDVPPQTEHVVRPSSIQMAATLEGITTAALPLVPWSGSRVAIDLSQETEEPQLHWTPARP
ncbi:hypothetical protein [Xanthomonas sp. D-109]|uniref:hypothetical protein n=1 Tax=Xanthomonas sp. D-109 TaxID=2821274 RepID=UPI001ADB0369|nr:hypothetical protein [Xanthomonas sp. D-109]MBO9880837.1 hypothetical protein [Xanthomonas sp. D-109]